jgi:hypothetical protein
MNWTVETLNDTVDAELAALLQDMQARFVWISNLIAEHGLHNVGQPYIKYFDRGLWEIKINLVGWANTSKIKKRFWEKLIAHHNFSYNNVKYKEI